MELQYDILITMGRGLMFIAKVSAAFLATLSIFFGPGLLFSSTENLAWLWLYAPHVILFVYAAGKT